MLESGSEVGAGPDEGGGEGVVEVGLSGLHCSESIILSDILYQSCFN